LKIIGFKLNCVFLGIYLVFQFPISSLGFNFNFFDRALTGDDRIELHSYLVVFDSF
jgi:hypothetical protein